MRVKARISVLIVLTLIIQGCYGYKLAVPESTPADDWKPEQASGDGFKRIKLTTDLFNKVTKNFSELSLTVTWLHLKNL
jgi:hypothetical protein